MTIKIRNMEIAIDTRFLSGGEEIFVRRLVEKSKKGNELNISENKFLLSMSKRSEAFSPNRIKKLDLQLYYN